MKLKVIKYHIYTYILDYYEHKDMKKIIENYEEKRQGGKKNVVKKQITS